MAQPKPPKKRQPPVPSASPFTELPTPVKGAKKVAKKVRAALRVQQEPISSTLQKSKNKPGRPCKARKGGKRVRKQVKKQNLQLEETVNDPPLHLREAVPDTRVDGVLSRTSRLLFGIKLYTLANDLGITLDFWPYGGSGSSFPGQPGWMDPFNCGEKIVMNFVHSNMLAPGSVITADRHFSSPTLAAILPDTFGVYYNGTVMQNRLYFPGYKLNNYNPTHTERGYYTWAFNERYSVFCSSWLDRDPVNFVSSAFGACPHDVVRGNKPEDRQIQFLRTPSTLCH